MFGSVLLIGLHRDLKVIIITITGVKTICNNTYVLRVSILFPLLLVLILPNETKLNLQSVFLFLS